MSWHKFWFWYCVIFAVSNTVVAMLSLETWWMYLDAWCAIVLVVCATVNRYRADKEREVHNGNYAS